eukprot:1375988-Amorphochlora_amoeboformis.AAC.1
MRFNQAQNKNYFSSGLPQPLYNSHPPSTHTAAVKPGGRVFIMHEKEIITKWTILRTILDLR